MFSILFHFLTLFVVTFSTSLKFLLPSIRSFSCLVFVRMISFADVTSVSFGMFHFVSVGSFRLYSYITLFLYVTLQLGASLGLSDCKLGIVLVFFSFRTFTLIQHTTVKESHPVAGVFCSVVLRF